MNKEEVDSYNAYLYSDMRRNWSEAWSESTAIPPHRRGILSYEAEQRILDRESEQKRMRLGFFFKDSDRASELYREHHAELYDLAREEMEADGILLCTEDDKYAITAYYYGEEIADLQRESPLNALGAMIVQIGQKHMDRVQEELG